MSMERVSLTLRRLNDNVVYEFDRMPCADGGYGYRRRDQNIWMLFKPPFGWVVVDPDSNIVSGRPWNVMPADQGDHPPEDEWVSKKGNRSYVYELRYVRS